jgi:hypothetical protein
MFAVVAFGFGVGTNLLWGFGLMVLYLGFVPLGIIARTASDKFPITSIVGRALVLAVLMIALAWWLINAWPLIRDGAWAKLELWQPILVVLIYSAIAFGWYLTDPLPPRNDDAKLADPDELKRAGISRDL